ncbi:MAG TPA: rRNA maturation RNase YbeY [Phycisphaerales bacterium]|nr:rRNA maturation RNase YbeY [Phycisphaerales bacterium]HRQ75084.1 rRNA maturation RNase YbeY [Phycisphaerales bacterium]
MNAHVPTMTGNRAASAEPDDPGPSRSASADDQPPEPEIDLGGEAASRLDLSWLRVNLRRAVDAMRQPVREVNVAIVHDDAMSMLHERHANIAGTTDVLTFPRESAGDTGGIAADIAVCFDEAARRAAQFGHSVEREILLYILHGLLHCAGHDDHDEAAYAAMHVEEDRILSEIGVGRTFAAPSEATGHDAARKTVRRDRGNEG